MSKKNAAELVVLEDAAPEVAVAVEAVTDVNAAAPAAPVATAPVAVAEAAPLDSSASDERYSWITDPVTKEPVKRKDYILKLWTEQKMSRGDIARHLTEITGKKVPYQIVFSTTKKVAGGPDKAAAAPVATPAPVVSEVPTTPTEAASSEVPTVESSETVAAE